MVFVLRRFSKKSSRYLRSSSSGKQSLLYVKRIAPGDAAGQQDSRTEWHSERRHALLFHPPLRVYSSSQPRTAAGCPCLSCAQPSPRSTLPRSAGRQRWTKQSWRESHRGLRRRNGLERPEPPNCSHRQQRVGAMRPTGVISSQDP